MPISFFQFFPVDNFSSKSVSYPGTGRISSWNSCTCACMLASAAHTGHVGPVEAQAGGLTIPRVDSTSDATDGPMPCCTCCLAWQHLLGCPNTVLAASQLNSGARNCHAPSSSLPGPYNCWPGLTHLHYERSLHIQARSHEPMSSSSHHHLAALQYQE